MRKVKTNQNVKMMYEINAKSVSIRVYNSNQGFIPNVPQLYAGYGYFSTHFA